MRGAGSSPAPVPVKARLKAARAICSSRVALSLGDSAAVICLTLMWVFPQLPQADARRCHIVTGSSTFPDTSVRPSRLASRVGIVLLSR
jgi:hypothetical protein